MTATVHWLILLCRAPRWLHLARLWAVDHSSWAMTAGGSPATLPSQCKLIAAAHRGHQLWPPGLHKYYRLWWSQRSSRKQLKFCVAITGEDPSERKWGLLLLLSTIKCSIFSLTMRRRLKSDLLKLSVERKAGNGICCSITVVWLMEFWIHFQSDRLSLPSANIRNWPKLLDLWL